MRHYVIVIKDNRVYAIGPFDTKMSAMERGFKLQIDTQYWHVIEANSLIVEFIEPTKR